MNTELFNELIKLSKEELIEIIFTESRRHAEVEKSHQILVGNLITENNLLREQNKDVVLIRTKKGSTK